MNAGESVPGAVAEDHLLIVVVRAAYGRAAQIDLVGIEQLTGDIQGRLGQPRHDERVGRAAFAQSVKLPGCEPDEKTGEREDEEGGQEPPPAKW